MSTVTMLRPPAPPWATLTEDWMPAGRRGTFEARSEREHFTRQTPAGPLWVDIHQTTRATSAGVEQLPAYLLVGGGRLVFQVRGATGARELAATLATLAAAMAPAAVAPLPHPEGAIPLRRDDARALAAALESAAGLIERSQP